MVRVTFLLPEKKSGLPKVGKRTDLPTTQNRLCLRLATIAAGKRLASTDYFFLRQRCCLPSALRGLNALKGFKDLRGPSRQQTPPLLRSTPSNSEGDNFEFWQMRVSERIGCLQTLPSGSILDKTTFCQFCIPLMPLKALRTLEALGAPVAPATPSTPAKRLHPTPKNNIIG